MISRSRLLLYSTGSAGLNLLALFVMSKFLYYYDDKIGDPLVPMVWATAALLSGRLLDAVIDPFLGGWNDRLTSRFGRRKLFMALGLPIALASFFFVWNPPFTVASPLWFKVGFLFLVTNLFFLSFTFYGIPYDAHLGEIAPEEEGRLRASRYKAIFALVGVAISVPVLALADIGRASVFTLLLAAPLLLLAFFGIRESSAPANASGGAKWPAGAVRLLVGLGLVEAASNLFLKYVEYFNHHLLVASPVAAETRSAVLYGSFVVAMIAGMVLLVPKRASVSRLGRSLLALTLVFPLAFVTPHLDAALRLPYSGLWFAAVGFSYGAVAVLGIALVAEIASKGAGGLAFGSYAFAKKTGFAVGIAFFALHVEVFSRLGRLELGFTTVGFLLSALTLAAFFTLRPLEAKGVG